MGRSVAYRKRAPYARRVCAEKPQAGLSPDAYDAGWESWNDMIRFSPAPWHRRRLIARMARSLRFASVLDVGCGNAETLTHLSQHFDCELWGVDLSPAVIARNRQRLPGIEFRTLDLEAGALERRFDLVVCSEVLEHCTDPQRALEHLRRMSASHLIVTVPSGPILPIDRAMGHLRHYHPASLSEALEGSGFRVVKLLRWGFPFHSAYKVAINLRPEQTLRGFAGGEYGRGKKAMGLLLRGLFHLNLPGVGRQLVALARVA